MTQTQKEERRTLHVQIPVELAAKLHELTFETKRPKVDLVVDALSAAYLPNK